MEEAVPHMSCKEECITEEYVLSKNSSSIDIHDTPVSIKAENKVESYVQLNTSSSTNDYSIGWGLPFPPHSVQRNMINTFLTAARSGNNSIIDSPTGTGKTLALLCAGLKYHEEIRNISLRERGMMNEKQREGKKPSHLGITVLGANNRKSSSAGVKRKYDGLGKESSDGTVRCVPPIFYCSRTHSQLKQVINELRSLGKKDIRMNVLASRDRYCINERVRTALDNKGNNLGEMCDKAVVMNQCSAHDKYEDLARTMVQVPQEWQIEDLVENGKIMDACPYYAARDLIYNAHINFCPYNYILDPIIRHETKIEGVLKDAVVILDEAHNIDDVCRGTLEWQWTLKDLESVVVDLQPYIDGEAVLYSKKTLTDKPEKCSEMSQLVQNLAKQMINILDCDPQMRQTYRGKSSKIVFSKEIEQKIPLILTLREDIEVKSLFASALRSFMDFGVTFNALDAEVKSIHTIKTILIFTNLFLFRSSSFSIGVNDVDKIIETYCADASLAFKLLEQDVRCVVLASGTLPQTEFITKELRSPFTQEVRCGHVVDVRKAVFGKIITNFGRCLYANMYETDFIDRMGSLLLKSVESTTNGRLCFFPSYKCLHEYVDRWTVSGITQKIQKLGVTIFQEPRVSKAFGDVLHQYRISSRKTKGALMLAVYRGKAAEGIDFKDHMARLIICIGVPYKSATENRTIFKKKFNSECSQLSGDLWYKTDAVTAVNQAIGRCIRHQKDYGVLLLVDDRWRKELFGMLPKWLQSTLHACEESDSMYSSMASFLKQKGMEKNVPKVEYIEVS